MRNTRFDSQGMILIKLFLQKNIFEKKVMTRETLPAPFRGKCH